MSDRGLFIVFEGIDGAGTTTQARLLEERIRREQPGRPVLVTAEPSTGPIGVQVRQILKERVQAVTATGHRQAFDRRSLALLFAADRIDHVKCEIEPLVADGWIVISDRYVLSSLAYQGMDAPPEWVAQINRWAPAPDLQLFVDVPAVRAWERIRSTRPGREIFETPDTLTRVSEAYVAALPLCFPDRTLTLPGDRPIPEVAALVWDAVSALQKRS
jgi:dTMP kinase